MAINKIADPTYYTEEFAEGIDVVSAFNGLATPSVTMADLVSWTNGDYRLLEELNGVKLSSPKYERKGITKTKHRARVAGWDVRLAAPKDFSVLWALAPTDHVDKLELLQRVGVHAAMTYLSTHGIVGRRQVDGVNKVVPLQPLIVGVHHATNRLHEPHLHSHCLVFADGYDPETERLRALHSPWIYRHYRAALAIHRATIRYELTQLLPNVSFTLDAQGQWRISAVSPLLMEEFSSRSQNVEQYLALKLGQETVETIKQETPAIYYDLVQEAVFATRREKNYQISGTEHRSWWHRAAEPVVGSLRRWWHSYLVDNESTEALDDEELVSQAVAFVSERSATWTREDLVVAICDLSPIGIPSVSDVERLADMGIAQAVSLALVDSHGKVIDAATSSVIPSQLVEASKTTDSALSRLRTRYSTQNVLDMEQSFLIWAQRGLSRQTQLPVEHLQTALIDAINLSEEQQHAITVMTQSEKACIVVRGAPGAGKTYMLATAVKAWESNDVPVYAVSFTGRASSELLQASTNASTIHKFLNRAKQGALPNRPFVVVCDEASMTSTRLLHELREVVESKGGRLVLIGDHRQLPSVSAGGLFSHYWLRSPKSGNDLVDGRAELRGNLRQVTPVMKEVVASLERNDTLNAMRVLHKEGDLVVGEDEEAVMRQTAKDWVEATLNGEETALLALKNDDVSRLNVLARSYLLEAWKKGVPSRLAPLGKIVVTDLEASVSHPSIGWREYRMNELIICLDNAHLRVGEDTVTVKNSWSGHIVGKTKDGVVVKFDHDDIERVLPFTYIAESTDYGYARTVYKSQGMTVGTKEKHGTVFLFRPEVLNAKAAWVAATRATHQLRLYVATKTQDNTRKLDDLPKALQDETDEQKRWKVIYEPENDNAESKKNRIHEIQKGLDLDPSTPEIDTDIAIQPTFTERSEEELTKVRSMLAERWQVRVQVESAAEAQWQLRMSERIATSHTVAEIDAEIAATTQLLDLLPALVAITPETSLQSDLHPTLATVVESLSEQLTDVLETTRSHVPLTEAVITLALDTELTTTQRFIKLVNSVSSTYGPGSDITKALLRLKRETTEAGNFDDTVETLQSELLNTLVQLVRATPDFAIQLAERRTIFELGKEQRATWEALSRRDLEAIFDASDLDLETFYQSTEREASEREKQAELNAMFAKQKVMEHIDELDTSFDMGQPRYLRQTPKRVPNSQMLLLEEQVKQMEQLARKMKARHARSGILSPLMQPEQISTLTTPTPSDSDLGVTTPDAVEVVTTPTPIAEPQQEPYVEPPDTTPHRGGFGIGI